MALVLRRSLAVGLAASTLFCASCGNSGRKAVYPAHGQVLFEGKPLPYAFVVFHPLGETGTNPVRPVGQGKYDGGFQLTTYDTHDGAPEGEYAITVEWRRPALTEDETPRYNLLPARYAKPETSGLRAQIVKGRNELPPIWLGR
jgi:hypothetical protein